MIPRRKKQVQPITTADKDLNGGAVQFFNSERIMEKVTSTPSTRWRSPSRPDAGCVARTKSEARIFFQELLGVKKLPSGFEIERY